MKSWGKQTKTASNNLALKMLPFHKNTANEVKEPKTRRV